MPISTLLLLLGAVLIGAALTWALMRQRITQAREQGRAERDSDVTAAQERARGLKEQLEEVKSERSDLNTQVQRLQKRVSTLQTKKETLEERLAEQEERLEEQQEQLRNQFENLANDILEEKTEKFTEQNEEALDDLIDPLQEKLDAFKEKVQETYEKGLKERSSLEEKLEHLNELNQEMSKRADDLTNALEGQSKTQGDWGEMILERILEESGLQEGREYQTQVSRTNGQGKTLRPDVVVTLPEDRYVIVDAKVSIVAYRRFVSAEDEEEQETHLKEHLQSVRNHVDGLAAKNYGSLYGDRSPDFVLLFVPIESAFALALQHDESLYQDAFDQGVIIVSPTTLQATIATIANIWRQERQTQNAREIAERGGRLYDKFVLFAEALEEIGERIDQAQESYRTARKRLSDGRGNLLRQVEMLRELGAENSKTLPESLQEDASLGRLDDRAEGEEA